MNDKQQLAAMGDHMAEQAEQAAQPLCMAKRIEELEAQVRGMSSLLLELRECAEFEVADGELPADTVGRIDAALSGNVPESSIPEGWKMVPVVPTREMREAFHEANEQYEEGQDCDDFIANGDNGVCSPDHQWAAMLASSPKPDSTK